MNCKPEAYGVMAASALLLTDLAAVTFSASGNLTLAAAISKAAACRRSLTEAPLCLIKHEIMLSLSLMTCHMQQACMYKSMGTACTPDRMSVPCR